MIVVVARVLDCVQVLACLSLDEAGPIPSAVLQTYLLSAHSALHDPCTPKLGVSTPRGVAGSRPIHPGAEFVSLQLRPAIEGWVELLSGEI